MPCLLDKQWAVWRSDAMSIYIDESIHARANFIVLAAVVASEEQTQQAEKALSSCGFVPGQDEFKSSMKMAGNPGAQQLRDRFQEIIGKCQIAFGVCSVHERDQLMSLAGRIIEAITHHGSYAEQTVYLDQGMKSNSVKLPDGFTLEMGCDSKSVIGIQLADCCAHFVSSVILGEMGLFKKMVPASRVYPGDPGELELAWELWASIRYALAGPEPAGTLDDYGDYEPLRKPFGMVFSDGCDVAVAQAVRKRLGKVWIGCIH